MCPLGRRRARAKQGAMLFRNLKANTRVLACASSARDRRAAVQVASPQRTRMDGQRVVPWHKIGHGLRGVVLHAEV